MKKFEKQAREYIAASFRAEANACRVYYSASFDLSALQEAKHYDELADAVEQTVLKDST